MEIDINNIDPISFEESVGQILAKLCKAEGVPFGRADYVRSNHNKGSLVADFLLKKGCKALNCPEETLVEVKMRLTNNSFNHLKQLSDYSNTQLLVITLDFNYISLFTNNLKGRGIKIISFNELLKIADEIKEPENNRKEVQSRDFVSKLTISNNLIIEQAHEQFKRGNITLFLGAGVSASAGLPSWDKLLKNILSSSDQNPLSEDDYPAICVASFSSPIVTARHLFTPFLYLDDKNKNNVEKLIDRLKSALYPDNANKKSLLISTIVEMCKQDSTSGRRSVSSIITLNYDDLVETEMDNQNVEYELLFEEGIIHNEALPVIHVHGVLRQSEPTTGLPVLSEEEYHDLYKRSFHWSNIEMLHAFYRSTCIFIGLSMSDPNLRRLLEFVASESNGIYPHYAILPKGKLSDYNWDSPNPTKYYESSQEKEEEFLYRRIKIFKKLGVNVIWYESCKFEQIPKILKKIAGIKKND